ncbi:non-homologous end joining protein Ku [Chondromyces apiculatus]|uniref:Non-homologous end joining protein Ku n=1 Tax=Chondromyces apiculatus DSM 436 TaxID=1192034 RepID=A0A017TCS6_9BACT|nr:Ku protein [Chondromyces apiculatus]EYF06732.1 Ku domain protein [Chondromyces apiculatus DSM 436]
MALRANASGTISFGLVTIPVKIYTATTSHRVSFHMLHEKCGTRVHMQYVCPTDEEVVSRKELVRGFEHAKDQFVTLTEKELKQLEGERSDRIDILEFVPESAVDFTYFSDTHYLGPGKGGDRAYLLLAQAMTRTERLAIGRYGARGQDQLVLLRPYEGGLAMHKLHYADEVRSMSDVDYPRKVPFKQAEMDLAERLIDQLAVDSFDPGRYHDEYRDRVLEAVDQKIAGEEVTVAPEAPPAKIVDLFEALKRSLSDKSAGKAARGKTKRGSSKDTRESTGEAASENTKKARPRSTAVAHRTHAKAARRPGVHKTTGRRRSTSRTGTSG